MSTVMLQSQFLITKYQQFQQKFESRKKIKISLGTQFQSIFDTMQYLIISKFQKNAKNQHKNKNNKQCDKVFKRAFKQLTDIQKIHFYIMLISFFQQIVEQNLFIPYCPKGSIKSNGFTKSLSKYGWKQVLLKVDFDKKYLYIERQNKMKAYDLHYYIVRRSKATEYNSIVLEAINSKIDQKGYQIYIGFQDIKIYRQWFQQLTQIVSFNFWNKIKLILYPSEIQFQSLNFNQSLIQKKCFQNDGQKLVQSQIIVSQKKIIDNEINTKLAMSVVNNKNFHEIDEKSQHQSRNSQLQNSCHSVQIKQDESLQNSQIKQKGHLILMNSMIENGYEQSNTFRSIQRLDEDDIVSNQNDKETMLFSKLFPNYDINKIDMLSNQFKEVFKSENEQIKIYSHFQHYQNLKIFINISKNQIFYNAEQISLILGTTNYFKLLNSQIEQLTTKTIISSENSAILYQKNKPYNRLYRSRDFVFIRHQFSKDKAYYIVDKSVQDVNIPPFTTIVRGQLSIIYKIFEDKQINNGSEIIRIQIESKIKNHGYLKDFQQLNINLKLYKGFQNFLRKLNQLRIQNPNKINSLLKSSWLNPINHSKKKIENDMNTLIQQNFEQPMLIIQPQTKQSNTNNNVDIQYNSANKQSSNNKSLENCEQINQSIQKMQFQGQISETQPYELQKIKKIQRQFDQSGNVIISNSFINTNYQTKATKEQSLKYQIGLGGVHPIWKGNWEFLQQGGFKFINKKQIQDQKNVLKFIFSQVAKNLVSGKSILNISLPVDIFSSESNLQRFVYSMSYAPLLLQPSVKTNQVDRFLNSVIFGMTNSPMYLEMQKPFNPILGETFQCFINGCPAYAQQISHHPPIAAFMLIGRGYRISTQIQSKMKLNINSGVGCNQGIYRIQFDNQKKEQICYMCPGGQVSGLAYGDRKFNFIGKAFGWCEQTGFFLEIVFNPKKGFFGKQQTPIDYVQGKVLRVKQSFIKQFSKSNSGGPKKNQILEQLGKFHGTWNRKLFFNQKQMFDYDKLYPLQLQYESNPLPSDSNWRQDIAYRRILQISKAQTWKQKLQIQQRHQRKLRQKYINK